MKMFAVRGKQVFFSTVLVSNAPMTKKLAIMATLNYFMPGHFCGTTVTGLIKPLTKYFRFNVTIS